MGLTTFNVFKKKARSFGGITPVWKYVKGKIMSGAALPDDSEKGLYPAGTPVEIDTAKHTAKILRYYIVAKAVSATDTEVAVKVAEGLPSISDATIVMKAPSSITGTGKAVKVGALASGTDTDGKPTKVFTITANALGALAAGDILVEAATAGANAPLAVKPNALLEDDIYMDEDTQAATATGVYHGDVYANRIRWVLPDFVKAALPQIFFDYSN